VPLDVCAQSMYRAIHALVQKVSNLSLHEVHLVNIVPETTEVIQSVFYQLSSASGDGGSVGSESPPASVDQPQRPSPSASSVGADLGGDNEVLDLRSKDVQTSAPRETSPGGRKTPSAEVMEEDRQSSVASPQHPSENCHSPEDETIPDEGQAEGQESMVEQSQDSSSVVPDAEESFDDDDVIQEQQKSLVVEHGEKKREDTVQVMTERIWNDEDGNDQSFDVTISDRKSLEHGQALRDQEEEKSAADEEQISQTAVKDSCEYSAGGKDSETGERAGYEDRHHLSSKPEPELGAFMQELSLEEYREAEPASPYHEPAQVVPSDTPQGASGRSGGPWSLAPGRGDDHENFYSLSADTAAQDRQQ